MQRFKVVDLFAGPGGLAEGFNSFNSKNNEKPFETAFSVEKDVSAHKTLRLRAFLRQFRNFYPQEYYDAINLDQPLPDFAKLYPSEWAIAELEALNLELGTDKARDVINNRVDNLNGDHTVLIGGPPCQAYSLVGRSRNQSKKDYVPEKDGRHFLYQEYIRILQRLAPAAFVMENVKGLISSRVNGNLVGDRLLRDLRSSCKERGGYELIPVEIGGRRSNLSEPAILKDFVIKTELHGIPQARHRVIIVGIRRDLYKSLYTKDLLFLHHEPPVFVESVLRSLPKLRSGLSRSDDGFERWQKSVISEMKNVIKSLDGVDKSMVTVARNYLEEFRSQKTLSRGSGAGQSKISKSENSELSEWIEDPRLKRIPNHETRGHMQADLARYFFAAIFANVNGISPKAPDFPEALAPNHTNWFSGKFVDRFRVQMWNKPSTTITSHISKDGHYFIHPDPLQCRSLTVREAARLQTFPDNYVFLGNRTQQYVQVGNAVPPLLANKIAEALYRSLDTCRT